MLQDKVALAHKRAELINSLTTPLSNEERVHIQGELSIINAKVKALNTTEAAQAKAAADRRRIMGLAEARDNAARARVKANNCTLPDGGPKDGTSEQAAEIEGWIDAVLLRHDIDFSRSHGGKTLDRGHARQCLQVGFCSTGVDRGR